MNLRLIVAIAAIAIIIAEVYVISFTPYLVAVSEGKTPAGVRPGLEVIIPATALPLILVLIFLVPARRKDDRDELEERRKFSGNEAAAAAKTTTTEPEGKRLQSYEEIGQKRYRRESLVAGAIAGLIAALVLVGLIFVGDVASGLPVGTFYLIIAKTIANLDTQVTASIFGLALHLMTGTAIGGIFGILSAVIEPFNITSTGRGVAIGVLAGFLSFSILFIPITRFQVEPTLIRILPEIGISDTTGSNQLETRATDIMSSVLAFSVLFHVIYGAIMGLITAVLLLHVFPKRRSRIRTASQNENNSKNSYNFR